MRTHKPLSPTRNDYQQQTIFPRTKLLGLLLDLLPKLFSLATGESWHPLPHHHTAVSPDKAGGAEQIFQRALHQMARSHFNFDHSAVVANGQ